MATSLRSRNDPTDGLENRLRALAEAVAAADGRLEPGTLGGASSVVTRSAQRLGLGLGHTVVALAGATGSGKSSLFNALAGTDLSQSGVRRPTTAAAHACVWGGGDADPLLDWLVVPRRHVLPAARIDPDLEGLVLLDLPDHDSTERSHRAEVDRLVGVVDLLVWVLDPQKYADAAVHERYLAPLAGHAGVMLVLLNQADRLTADARTSCVQDLRQLLGREGLGSVPVLPTSARTGDGLADLRSLLAERVASRRAATARLAADVTGSAERLGRHCSGPAPRLQGPVRAAVTEALAEAAGLPTVTTAVDRAYRSRAALATGWPPLRWVRRLRPDAMRRLHLADGPAELGRTSLPAPSAASRARVSSALRRLGDDAGSGLPEPWPHLVQAAARREETALGGRLDAAVAGTDLGMGTRPAWWSAVGLVQKALLGVALVGLLWLFGMFAWSYLALGTLPVPHVGRLPVPTLLLLAGLLGGLLLALLARRLAALGGRRRARVAGRRLQERVDSVATGCVLNPVEEELAAYGRFCAAVGRAHAGE